MIIIHKINYWHKSIADCSLLAAHIFIKHPLYVWNCRCFIGLTFCPIDYEVFLICAFMQGLTEHLRVHWKHLGVYRMQQAFQAKIQTLLLSPVTKTVQATDF